MKLGSIQFLRGMAATLVVYAHSIDLTQRYGKPWQGRFHYLSDVGCIGVDLFFVISGFIITYVAGKYTGASEGTQFLQKRFYRINPIYYIASIVYILSLMIRSWMAHKTYPIWSEKFINSALDTLMVIPLGDGYSPLLMIGWTLSFEWLFYILFFLTILTRVKRKILLLSAIIGVLILLRYVLRPTDLRFAFITNPIMLEFLTGVLLCQLYLHLKKIPVWIPVLLLVVGIAGYVVLVFYNNPLIAAIMPIMNGSLSLDRFLYWGLPSGCIAAGCIFLDKAGKLNRLWNNRFSMLLGDASYSIYLVHFTAFSLLGILYRQVGFFLPPDLSIFFQVLVALGISIAFYWWVEKPLLKWLQKPSRKNKPLETFPTPSAQPQAT
ncbi:acyltransferase [Pseudoflavitalea sp. X16]|uniref:acyltransferase family protein n=1 Tax=Paraflavitalea devenefica TaxID=2716334 RepID=UPI0014210379|nr:acyltransferase [Paraflavitalea devenefica]NII27757.1 acyltransferase [Paraflavitalea devenefica]